MCSENEKEMKSLFFLFHSGLPSWAVFTEGFYKTAWVRAAQESMSIQQILGKSSIGAFLRPPTWNADHEPENLSTLPLFKGCYIALQAERKKASQILIISSLRCHQQDDISWKELCYYSIIICSDLLDMINKGKINDPNGTSGRERNSH